MIAVSAFDWIEAATKQHSDDTDAAWLVTYKGLDTKTIDVNVERRSP
jgi:hypothetical protein